MTISSPGCNPPVFSSKLLKPVGTPVGSPVAPVIKVSLAASAAGFVILLLAVTYPGVLLATGVFILSKTLLRTVIISLASKRVTAGQGATMGLSNSFMSLGRIVGPTWAGFIFDVNVNYPYLSGAAIMFVGFLISLVWVSQKD